ncbi:MAG: hypothetical protein FIA99_12015 [Ruminiclostridium sp.]|nr:hypothetical protein [Ruminiclostridium sp.]
MFNKLISNFSNLLGNNFNDIIIAFLIILAVYWFIKYDIAKLARIRNSFSRLCREAEMIRGTGIDNMKKLDGLFSGRIFKPIRDIWSYYYEDFRTLANKDKTPDISEYFGLHTALVIPASRKRAEVIPGMLAMIGILGTFLGITAGLPGIDLTASGTAAQENIGRLLNVAASAFSISIAAIILSIVFQLFDRHIYQSAVAQMGRFLNLAARKVPMANDSMSLELLISEQRSQTEGLQKLGTVISSQLSDFVGKNMAPSLSKTFEDAVRNQIAPSIKTMSDMLNQISQVALDTQTKGMQVMADSFIEKLNTTMGVQFQTLGRNIQGMLDRQTKTEQNLNKLMEEILKNADAQKMINTETAAVLNVVSEYHKQVKDINTSMVESVEKMALFNDGLREVLESDKQSLDGLNEQRTAMQEENREYLEMMDSQVRRLMEDLNVQLDAAFSRFNDITSLAFDRMDKSMSSTVEGMSSNMKTLFDSMDDQVRDISLYAKGLSEEVNELNGKLESSVKEFGQQLHTGVVNTLNTFDGGLSEICGRFGHVITDVRDAIEDLPAIIGAIGKNGESNREMDK